MTTKPLGRLERVELREIWPSEASDFTPWLAGKDNLGILGDTLGTELELKAQEKPVGPFRADILCKEIGTGAWVLIENQLEKTDHNHLGQILTYASGLQAATIVWVAARFTDEHRATLDWLNRITDTSFRFFGLEIELWKIGDSEPAPKFNIVASPNGWSQSIAQAARNIDDGELGETRVMQRDYWTALEKVLSLSEGPVNGGRRPQPQSWMTYSIGRAYFSLNLVMVRTRRQVRAELYISGPNATAFFHILETQKSEIEEELGFPLDWQELPDGQASRISISMDNVDPGARIDWPRQHEWLANHLNALHRVFAPRVRELDADGWQPEPPTE